MNAKRFFYVCARLFLLAAAYSIGAHRADAQSGGALVDFAGRLGYQLVAGDASGQLYYCTASTAWQPTGHCPPGTPMSFHNDDYEGGHHLAMANGDTYLIPHPWELPNPPTFQFLDNVLGGPIQVEGKSMSDSKGASGGNSGARWRTSQAGASARPRTPTPEGAMRANQLYPDEDPY